MPFWAVVIAFFVICFLLSPRYARMTAGPDPDASELQLPDHPPATQPVAQARLFLARFSPFRPLRAGWPCVFVGAGCSLLLSALKFGRWGADLTFLRPFFASKGPERRDHLHREPVLRLPVQGLWHHFGPSPPPPRIPQPCAIACSTWWPCGWNADGCLQPRCCGRFTPSGS